MFDICTNPIGICFKFYCLWLDLVVPSCSRLSYFYVEVLFTLIWISTSQYFCLPCFWIRIICSWPQGYKMQCVTRFDISISPNGVCFWLYCLCSDLIIPSCSNLGYFYVEALSTLIWASTNQYFCLPYFWTGIICSTWFLF